MKINKSLSLLIFLLPCICNTVFAGVSVFGYYKNYCAVENPPAFKNSMGINDSCSYMVDINVIRTNLKWVMNPDILFEAAYDVSPRIKDPKRFNSSYKSSGLDYRVNDLNPLFWHPSGGFGAYQNLDRFFVAYKLNFMDCYVGRQAISWGSAKAVNPTDILLPYTLTELDTEERIGVDAVRFRIPTGTLSELDFGSVFGKDFEYKKSAQFLRSKWYVLKTDVSLILMNFKENIFAGFDMVRGIKGANWWLEAGFTDAYRDDDYFRASTGLDYTFTGDLYGFIEYHCSSAGSSDPDEYTQLTSKPAFTEGSVYLLGRNYCIPGISYQITPLIIFSGSSVYNIDDNSILLTPQIEYNCADNIYISLGSFFCAGKRPEEVYSPSQSSIRYASEFGAYTTTYYTSIRFYF